MELKVVFLFQFTYSFYKMMTKVTVVSVRPVPANSEFIIFGLIKSGGVWCIFGIMIGSTLNLSRKNSASGTVEQVKASELRRTKSSLSSSFLDNLCEPS